MLPRLGLEVGLGVGDSPQIQFSWLTKRENDSVLKHNVRPMWALEEEEEVGSSGKKAEKNRKN